MKGLATWRIALAIAILGVLAILLAVCAPYYFRNMQLQSYVATLTHSPGIQRQSDHEIRTSVLQKAQELRLPIVADNVLIYRQSGGALQKVDVRYMVPIDLPGYTVKLHFYPGAGSR